MRAMASQIIGVSIQILASLAFVGEFSDRGIPLPKDQ